MKNTTKFISILSISLFLSACGGGSSGDSETAATLDDLVGVWDESVTVGQEFDEIYTVIKADGTVITYDYNGDSYDNGSNCYWKDISSIEDLGDGKFLYEETTNLDISIKGDTYTVTNVSEDSSFTGKRTARLETDFQPLCNSVD